MVGTPGIVGLHAYAALTIGSLAGSSTKAGDGPTISLRVRSQPALMLFGDADPTGTVDVWRRFVVATMCMADAERLPLMA